MPGLGLMAPVGFRGPAGAEVGRDSGQWGSLARHGLLNGHLNSWSRIPVELTVPSRMHGLRGEIGAQG